MGSGEIDLSKSKASLKGPKISSNPELVGVEDIEGKKERMEIVKLFRAQGLLIKPSTVEELKGKNEEEILEIIKKIKNLHEEETIVVTETELNEIIQETKSPIFAEASAPSDFKPMAKEFGHEFKVHMDKDITGRSRCGGGLSDFVKNVNDRFQNLKNILESRPSNNKHVKLERAAKLVGESVRVVGMVNRKGVTKNGHISLEIEDETASMFILVLKGDKEAFEKARKIIKDDVIALDIKVGTNFCMVKDVTWPDMVVKSKKTIDKDISIAFISDIHIGSKNFCGKEFERMIRWLNGSGPYKEIAEKIGYLLIAGDIVDGIGIYPKQENNLAIKDIFEQYRIVQKMFEMIPPHIKIIIVPGDHDAVRLSEPQPAISIDMIGKLPNVISIGNPGFVNIEGFETILYHGQSILPVASNIPGLTPAKPEEVVVELLKRRCLSPMYDEGDIAPEHKDYHFIDNCDIINTGHMHKNGYTEYRGCVVVTSGTWQWLTDYQVKQGHVATPCILPVYNLKEGRITHLDFKNDEVKILG